MSSVGASVRSFPSFPAVRPHPSHAEGEGRVEVGSVRFSDPAHDHEIMGVGAPGTRVGSDGEGVIAILQAAERSRRRRRVSASRREESSRGEPGTRRFRRYLNSTLSDYDSEVDLSDTEAPDHPIVHFDWDSKFVAAGTEFFTDPTLPSQTNGNEAMKNQLTRTQRRLLRMMRNRKLGKHQKSGYKLGRKESDQDDEDEMEETIEKEEIIEVAQTTSPSSSSSSSLAPSNSHTHSHSHSHSLIHSHSHSHSHLPPTSSSSTSCSSSDRFIPSHSDFAEELWRSLDRGVRSILRKMYDFTFLIELETLLIQYKRKKINAVQAAGRNYKGQFQCIAPTGREEEVEANRQQRAIARANNNTSTDQGVQSELDGDEWVLTDREDTDTPSNKTNQTASDSSSKVAASSSSSSSCSTSSSSDPLDIDLSLDLLFEDGFHRLLGHAIIHFHQLKSSSRTSSNGYRHTIVTRHNSMILHRAKLHRYIQENFADRGNNTNRGGNRR